MAIGVDATRKHYVTIAEARKMDGLRVVLGEFAIPGPWHEACKSICYVKGLEYTPVRSSNEGASDAMTGMFGTQSELIEWTGWAVASWSAGGLAFAVYTAANLGPRAWSTHRWYRRSFPDYPVERKALIPSLI